MYNDIQNKVLKPDTVETVGLTKDIVQVSAYSRMRLPTESTHYICITCFIFHCSCLYTCILQFESSVLYLMI